MAKINLHEATREQLVDSAGLRPGPTHEISHSRRRSSEGQDSHRNR